MILYEMRCVMGHGFDGWFRSSADFDAQGERGLLACPACGSSDVSKALMAPAVRLRGAKAPQEPLADASEAPAATDRPESVQGVALVDETHTKMRRMLRDLRAHMTANSEDVGERFPDVARKMHSEEIETRSVHGRATAEEARALVEEGVEIRALPTFPDEMN